MFLSHINVSLSFSFPSSLSKKLIKTYPWIRIKKKNVPRSEQCRWMGGRKEGRKKKRKEGRKEDG